MPSTLVRFDGDAGLRGFQRIGTLPIASGQTYKQGDYLAVNSSGQLILAVAAGNGSSTNGQVPVWSSGSTNLIAGRAIEDAQPATNDPTSLPVTKLYGRFTIAEPGTQFLLPIFHNTSASAYPNPNQIGAQYGLWNLTGAGQTSPATWPTGTVTPATVWVVRIDETAVVQCQIVDFLGDQYPNPSGNGYWPNIGQAAAPSSGTTSQFCGAWVEFLGGTTLLSGARPITRTN